MSFTSLDRARIRGLSGCDERTIKKYPNVSEASRMRIERACSELNIKPAASTVPPPPASGATLTCSPRDAA